jgi:hypothetical protein
VLFIAQFLTITRIQPFSPDLLVTCLEEKEVPLNFPQLQEIVKEPLQYLSNGNEAVAFVSADDKYVLKFFFTKHFFNRVHYKPKDRIRQILGPRFRVEKAHAALRRYEQGLANLPEETAMLAVHHYRSPEILPVCTLKDREGKMFSVDLNNVAFVVQRKCRILSKIEFAKEQENLDPKFQDLFSSIANKGFVNLSGTFYLPNFALLDDRAVMIDLGKLEYRPEEAYQAEEEKFQERYLLRLQKCVYRIR